MNAIGRKTGSQGSCELTLGLLDKDNIWCQALEVGLDPLMPALFLDRDGVVVEWVPYLHRVEDVAIIPGAADTIAAANRLGFPVVMITNQAGIGRGYYGWREFQAVQQAIADALDADGAHIDGVFAC